MPRHVRPSCLPLAVALVILSTWHAARAAEPARAAPDPARAVAELAGRVLGARASEFAFETVPADKGRDVFELESAGGKIRLLVSRLGREARSGGGAGP